MSSKVLLNQACMQNLGAWAALYRRSTLFLKSDSPFLSENTSRPSEPRMRDRSGTLIGPVAAQVTEACIGERPVNALMCCYAAGRAKGCSLTCKGRTGIKVSRSSPGTAR